MLLEQESSRTINAAKYYSQSLSENLRPLAKNSEKANAGLGIQILGLTFDKTVCLKT